METGRLRKNKNLAAALMALPPGINLQTKYQKESPVLLNRMIMIKAMAEEREIAYINEANLVSLLVIFFVVFLKKNREQIKKVKSMTLIPSSSSPRPAIPSFFTSLPRKRFSDPTFKMSANSGK